MAGITVDDFVIFSDRTLDGFRQALARLDDTSVNRAPDLPGANTPFQLVMHALGACDWWTAHMVLGHDTGRDRDAEFTAHGSVTDVLAALDAASVKLHELAPALTAATTLLGTPETETPLAGEWTVGASLIHAYEELAQHLGHLELTVDLLLRDVSAGEA